ncbi:MAG: magnesium transporter CorA [Clostridia bacterium]|nr:magnesium transporter CorA [Clostridia bacterium]
MQCYLIREQLTASTLEEAAGMAQPYVLAISPEEWEAVRVRLGMETDLDMTRTRVTKAEVNLDALTGSLCIPRRDDLGGEPVVYGFALNARGMIFIDPNGEALQVIERIQGSKKWQNPTLERFVYDYLEQLIGGDLTLLEDIEERLSEMEDELLEGDLDGKMEEVLDIRSQVLALRRHYEQLIDFGQELEENENGFFHKSQLRFFEMFTKRVIRLQDLVTALRDHIVQVRELYQTQQQEKQNHLMGILTVVSTIFLPLTLIAGWFGMNFPNMPLLNVWWGYPLVIVLSFAIVVFLFRWFKKREWF